MKQYNTNHIICGCDEAGRGSLAGPVVAGAVIFPKKFSNKEINDSKKISTKKREELNTIIKQQSIAWGIGVINVKTIDSINILNSSINAMHLAITNLIKSMPYLKPDVLLIDGNKFKQYKKIPHQCIIKGDSKYISIAAASILAKTYRDKLMDDLHQITPEYNWKKNKGYPTKEHKTAIMQFGITKNHRKSFKLLDEQYCLNF